MILVNKNGKALFDDGTVSDMCSSPVFKEAMSGNEVVTEPLPDEEGTGVIMIYAVPVKNAINDIAVASEEDASETSDLANETAAIVKRTNKALKKTNDVSKSAERLLELVSIFKV